MDSTNEKMDTVQLLDFSDEIFLEIFKDFSDVDLLNVAQVCKRFKEIAKDAVAKKYNGASDQKYLDIRVYVYSGAETQEIYCRFFETFGSQIKALKIFPGSNENNHLLKLINRNCRSTMYIQIWAELYRKIWNPVTCNYEDYDVPVTATIRGMSKLKSISMEHMDCRNFKWTNFRLPQLENLRLSCMRNLNVGDLLRLIKLNPQLKHLEVRNCDKFNLRDIEVLKDHLNELKSLQFTCGKNEFLHECGDIKVENLERLTITTDASSTANVLGAIGRGNKMIQAMEVIADYKVDVDQTLREFKSCIGLFHELTSLKLYSFEVGIDLLRILIQRLPKLTSLLMTGIHLRDVTTENILEAFRKGQQLRTLSLERRELNNIRLLHIFDSVFHRKFAEIVQNRGSGIKFELIQQNCGRKDTIIVTEKEIIKNGEIVYCAGYQEPFNQSGVHLFDLGDHVLEKIYDYSDDQTQRALYETCTKMRDALPERIKSQWFTVCDEETARDLFRRFGEHITKLEIDMKTDHPSEMAETWRLIDQHCSKNLVEMSINNIRVEATGLVPMELPNLSKLTVKSLVSSRTYIFPLIICPKLAHLEFHYGKISLSPRGSQFGITLNNLRTIRLVQCAKTTIEEIFSRLDDAVCDNIEELTIFQVMRKRRDHLVNILVRFQNLKTLHYADFGLEEVNFEYLFQSCTKLKTLTICIDGDTPPYWRRIVQSIKDNCNDLEVFHLYSREAHYFDPCIPVVVDLLPKVQLKIILREFPKCMYLVGTNISCSKPF